MGGVIVWYGVDGLHYAVMRAPAVDRPVDLFSAGLATLLGLVLILFPCRWLLIAIRMTKRHGNRPAD